MLKERREIVRKSKDWDFPGEAKPQNPSQNKDL